MFDWFILRWVVLALGAALLILAGWWLCQRAHKYPTYRNHWEE